jgi:type IV pilus assembly protein PilM
MRLIDNLIPFEPPQKYTLVPPTLLNFLTKERNVFSFQSTKRYIRTLGMNHREEIILKPFEEFSPAELREDEIIEILKEQVDKFKKTTKGKKQYYATFIPAQQGILRMYTFPPNMKKSEVMQALELYIQQEISNVYSNTDVLYRYTIMKNSKDEPYRIFVTIVERSAVEELQNIAQRLDIELDVISYELVVLLNFGFLNELPEPFAILYTDYTKIILLAYQRDRLLYEIFPFYFSPEIKEVTEDLNMLIWDLRNYIVLNDITNIFLAGVVLEYEEFTEFFLERLPIFGIVSPKKVKERFSLVYTLAERVIHAF